MAIPTNKLCFKSPMHTPIITKTSSMTAYQYNGGRWFSLSLSSTRWCATSKTERCIVAIISVIDVKWVSKNVCCFRNVLSYLMSWNLVYVEFDIQGVAMQKKIKFRKDINLFSSCLVQLRIVSLIRIGGW